MRHRWEADAAQLLTTLFEYQSGVSPTSSDLAKAEQQNTSTTVRRNWKPASVLEFLGLEPRMTVLDIVADGSYYSEIMARVVGPEGAAVALVFDVKASKDFPPLGASDPNLSLQALPMYSLRADSLAPNRLPRCGDKSGVGPSHIDADLRQATCR